MNGAALSPIRFPVDKAPDHGTMTEIAEGVLWARLPLPMQLDHVNVYALDEGDGWAVVDTGFDTPRAREVWQALLSGPLAGKPVRRVIATHHHPDHIGLAGWFQQQGAELVTTRTSWLYARMLLLDVETEVREETLTLWRAAGMEARLYDKRRGERPFNSIDVSSPLPPGYTRVAEGDVIRIGGRDWDVHTGNGHAPEHATFWSRDDALVLAGDQILPGISPNLGVYATEPGADPVGEWLESCTALQSFAREDHLVLPGHKLPFTGLPLRLMQLIQNHHSALDRLLLALESPLRVTDCFAALFRRSIGDSEYGLAMAESLGHLNHLRKTGQVVRRTDENGVWFWQRAAG